MKLSSLFAAFQRPATAAPEGAATPRQHPVSGAVQRSAPMADLRAGAARLPAPPPLAATEDVVEVSREASFRMAAERFDPRRISPNEMTELAGTLRQGGAIGAAEYALLLRGPGGDYRLADPDQARDAVADWQDSLGASMTRPDLRAVNADTRALNVLGRIAAARSQL